MTTNQSPSTPLPMIDGRQPVIDDTSGNVRITTDCHRSLYLNDEGKWESYRGQYKHWPTREAAEAFIRSLAPAPRLVKCGHVAYRNHNNLCIQEGCPHAAYATLNGPDFPPTPVAGKASYDCDLSPEKALNRVLESYRDGSLFGFTAEGEVFVHGKANWNWLSTSLAYLSVQSAQPAAEVGGLELLREQKSELESQLACACDLLNTWARETGGVKECHYPYGDLAMRDLIDRLWSTISLRCHERVNKAYEKLEAAESEIERLKAIALSAEAELAALREKEGSK